MQYLGGKSKWGRSIVQAIEPWRPPGAIWLEPFCGALNVVRWARAPRVALDACQPLITTLRATLEGWEPPEQITPETYARIKARPDPHDPLTAFVLFGVSFGGKWGAGYARPSTRSDNYARDAARSLLRKIRNCSGTLIGCLDYRRIPAPPPGTVVYADPPYQGTTGYQALPAFNSAEFWTYADWWHRCGALVFVSEGEGATPPREWVLFHRFAVRAHLELERAGRFREERLYVHRDSPMGRSLRHV